jgi:threonine dehydratase
MTVPTKAIIEEARTRIAPYTIHTPVLTSAGIDRIVGCKVYFKCENLQKIGAFKARGAMNAVLNVRPDDLRRGVATHSSGNHAQALARAAHTLGIPAFIVMPHTAPTIKQNGVHAYGGEIFFCEPTLAAREETLAEVVKKTGAKEIHPFNNFDVIAGQATAAAELLETCELDFILTPVGGGGLLSGTALAARYFAPQTKVIAGEPAGADDAYRSMQSGNIETSQANSIADGLLTSLGDKTFSIIRENVSRVITVSDQAIISAMHLVWEKLKMIIEPSAAVPVAALLKSAADFSGKRVGIILSGGNVDLSRAFQLFMQEGLMH